MQNKIKINRTEESIALIKSLASRDRNEAYEAQLALAAFVGPLVSEFIAKARTLSSLFTTLEYDAFDSPSIPVDLYYDITAEKEVQVWSQTTADGLATNFMQPVESDMKFHTNELNSAWHFDNKNVRAGRTDGFRSGRGRFLSLAGTWCRESRNERQTSLVSSARS